MSSHFCSVFIWSAKLFPALELCGNTVYILSFSRIKVLVLGPVATAGLLLFPLQL